jgi:hypothetical protein
MQANKEEIRLDRFYSLLNQLSEEIKLYNYYMNVGEYKQNFYTRTPGKPLALNMRELMSEFKTELSRLEVPIIEELTNDSEELKPLEIQGLENLKEEELIRLNYLRITRSDDYEKYFNHLKRIKEPEKQKSSKTIKLLDELHKFTIMEVATEEEYQTQDFTN